MPTMDAAALRREADGLPALRTALGLDKLGIDKLGLDELAPSPNEKRPDMYRPRKCLVELVDDPGPAKPVVA